ncbi:MAG TPA: hypothetical protein VHF22_01590, partial [Planctomycetota bacterium]|nr:hypothetical protein [Planctomycetota bacterium]
MRSLALMSLALFCGVAAGATQVPGSGSSRPAAAAALRAEARRRGENGFLESARALAREAVALDPLEGDGHVLRVELALASGALGEAIRAHAEIPRRRPDEADISLAGAIARAELASIARAGPPDVRLAALASDGAPEGARVAVLRTTDWDAVPRFSEDLLELLSLRDPESLRAVASLREERRADLAVLGAAAGTALGDAAALERLLDGVGARDPEHAAFA